MTDNNLDSDWLIEKLKESLIMVYDSKVGGMCINGYCFLWKLGQVILFIRKIYSYFLWMSCYCHARRLIVVFFLLLSYVYSSTHRSILDFIPTRIRCSTTHWSQNLLLKLTLACIVLLSLSLLWNGSVCVFLTHIFNIILGDVILALNHHLCVLP